MIKEFTQPIREITTDEQSVFSILLDRVNRSPDDGLIEYRDARGGWGRFTAREFLDRVTAFARGLVAKGIKPGDAVSILSRTRWEWTALDMAILAVGAVTVPVYETNSPAQVKAIFEDSHVIMAFAEDASQDDKIERVRSDVPFLREVLVIDSPDLDGLVEFGRRVGDAELRARTTAVRGHDLATIVYTSGSTGRPKGVEITHANLVSISYNSRDFMPEVSMSQNSRLLLFLPLAHVFARYLQYLAFAGTVTLGLTGNIRDFISDVRTFRPTFILGVPRIFEKIYNAASQKAGKGAAGRVFLRSVRVARAWSHAQQSGRPIPRLLTLRRGFYGRLVYRQILEVLGGNVEYAICGGAPLDPDIAHFFNGIGLPLLEGFGMTETCAPVSVNIPKAFRIGSVGKPIYGMGYGVAEDGELLIRGGSVCRGYHNRPDLTREAIVDGWLRTGDLGDIDEDGFAYVTGRKKDLIITAGGKNVSPEPLEAAVLSSPVIDQCMVIGDRKPFVAALVTVNVPDVSSWLVSQGLDPVSTVDETRRSPVVRAEIDRAVAKANALVSRAESIRKYVILDDRFSAKDGTLTTSLKIRRAAILDRFHEVIDHEIYVPRGRS
ncbi:AMP-binding protein [uncultured Bifidobacterium sp.]|uniref:AMP-dependent synthetase/ligase n=1 Tax=uncultured Bifidobacterium sp. TaxID=165187 RepID=UPI0028DD2F67|nr:AMP-binding protein [uncultured Bifidobacterium sp.]